MDGATTEIIIVRTVETCSACPSQWDAWDSSGQYWYLRYRHGIGSAERQPRPDVETWTMREPDIEFDGQVNGMADGVISLEDFARLAGITLGQP